MGICAWGSHHFGEDRKEFYEHLRRKLLEAEEAPGPWQKPERSTRFWCPPD